MSKFPSSFYTARHKPSETFAVPFYGGTFSQNMSFFQVTQKAESAITLHLSLNNVIVTVSSVAARTLKPSLSSGRLMLSNRILSHPPGELQGGLGTPATDILVSSKTMAC